MNYTQPLCRGRSQSDGWASETLQLRAALLPLHNSSVSSSGSDFIPPKFRQNFLVSEIILFYFSWASSIMFDHIQDFYSPPALPSFDSVHLPLLFSPFSTSPLTETSGLPPFSSFFETSPPSPPLPVWSFPTGNFHISLNVQLNDILNNPLFRCHRCTLPSQQLEFDFCRCIWD